MSTESVKVCDRELKHLAELAGCWDEMDQILMRYIQTMKTVQEEAVKDGKIHEAVGNLLLYAQEIHKAAAGLGGRAAGAAQGFVGLTEATDLNLYNGG